MIKKMFEGAEKFSYHYPKLAVIVTAHAEGKDNAMAVAWHSSISFKPPLYGISITSKRFTYELILKSQLFAINFMPLEASELVASVGGSSGKNSNKLERFNIVKETSSKTSAPVLTDAYACYECKLVDHKNYGDHEWVVGEVVATHLADGVFNSQGVIELAQINPSMYVGADYYTTASKDGVRHLDRKTYGNRC